MKSWNQETLAAVGIAVNWPTIVDRKAARCEAIMFRIGNPRDGVEDCYTDPVIGYVPLEGGERFTKRLSELLDLEPPG